MDLKLLLLLTILGLTSGEVPFDLAADCNIPLSYVPEKPTSCSFEDWLTNLFLQNAQILNGDYSYNYQSTFSCNADVTPLHTQIQQMSSFLTNSLIRLPTQLDHGQKFQETLDNILISEKCLSSIMSQIYNQLDNSTRLEDAGRKYLQTVSDHVKLFQGLAEKFQVSSKAKILPSNNSTCKIEFSGGTFLLYAHSEFGTDNLQRPVYFDYVNGTEADWIVEHVYLNNDNLFRLKNVKYGEYLGSHVPWLDANGEQIDAATSNQYYAECGDRYLWTLAAEDADGKVAALRHVATRALLWSVVIDNPYRQAVLDMRTGHRWKFVCDNK